MNNTNPEKLAELFGKRVDENLRDASDKPQPSPLVKNPWNRKEFFALKLGPGSVGNYYTIEETEIRLKYFVSYGWLTNSPNPQYNRAGFTPHPINKNWSVLLSFYQTITEKINEIDIQLHVLGFYTCGPCGLYSEVYGNIGDKRIFARAILSGVGGGVPPIEIISQGNYIFFVEQSIGRFSLSVFENITRKKAQDLNEKI